MKHTQTGLLVSSAILAWSVSTGIPATARAAPDPLTLSHTVSSERAPWPDKTLVLAWFDRDGGRLYPLPLLDRHGVVLDTRSGRRVAATWSPMTGTAVLLSLTGTVTPTASESTSHGWRKIRDAASASEWLPGKPVAVDGPSVRRLEAIPETALLPLGLARRLVPRAEVAVSDAPPALLNAAWQKTRKERLIPTWKSRLTVVLAREDAAAWRYDSLPRDGLVRTEIGGLKVLVVRSRHVTRAYMQPLTPTRLVGVDPWTGDPLLWTEGAGLWNGLTGQHLREPHTVTQALAVIELGEPAFVAHWPDGAIHAPTADREATQ